MKTRSLRNSGATICGQKESVIEEVKDRKTSTSTGQVAEGMILYDKLCGEPAASKLISLVNDLRAAGKKGQFQDRRIETIPGLLQDVIDRLLSMQVIPSKPDSCIIDVFNEGDHLQPQSRPHWFGRPICILLLNECEMTFGRSIRDDHLADYRGSLWLSLTPE
ncbi:hypothetical protein Nepgr_028123 [Nepenthes gracilis]|uniref:Uncharacterized protein n=1 Tax=Nepenthes gracilis TaxID=150966 RepID=A0AAD3Y3M5_NEPGR|nr:hypothetical protein Nepgr_028123 [Nepenthes gracilis]